VTAREVGEWSTAPQWEGVVAGYLEAGARARRELAAAGSGEVVRAARAVAASLRDGGCVLACGNGGSAADAQHLAGELVGRLLRPRRPLPALALTVNTSVLTALVNDYGAEAAFARQVEALGRPGDVLLALSTSGDSANVLEAVRAAAAGGLVSIGLTGRSGGRLGPLADIWVAVPTDVVPLVQELHTAVCHVICLLVERELA